MATKRKSISIPYVEEWKVKTRADSLGDQGQNMDATCDQLERGRKPSVANQKKPSIEIYRYCQIFLAEFVATSLLMFMVCSGCMKLNQEPISSIQSSIAAGFAVASLVQTFAHISDCHMNPAVTAFFLSIGKIDVFTSIIYVFAELSGACAGYGILWSLTPTSIQDLNMPGHCETIPHAAIGPIFGACIELIITSLLMFMICACVDPRNGHKQDSIPIKFGLTIISISLCAGNLTGASMNPARTFAPALWHNQWAHHWIYWVSPVSAGFIIPKIYNYFFLKDYSVKSN